MSNLELFKGNPLVNSDLFKSLMDLNKKLAGGSGQTGRRISLRGGKFRMMVDGEQVALNKTGALNMVIVNAAAVARTYYAGTYDSDNPTPPACWSHDTRIPAPEVPEETRQAARCADCPMNVKGSGQGESRACRFSQRLAVALEGELDTVYQLQVPAASLFGEAKGNDMGLQAYIKFLSAHNTPAIAVMTEVRFDDDSESPKLFFRPIRPLDEQELQTVLDQRESEDAIKAINLTVSNIDGVSTKSEAPKAEKPKAEKPKAEKPKAEKPKAAKVEDDDVEEPEVRKAKTEAPAPSVSSKLADVLSGWDDD